MEKRKMWPIESLIGSACGFVNGFFGGGGGMIVVPMLIKLLKMEQKKAHATCIAVILPVSIASAIIYCLTQGVKFAPLAWVTVGVCCGGALGALLLKKLSSKAVGYIFCVVMLAAGIRMLF